MKFRGLVLAALLWLGGCTDLTFAAANLPTQFDVGTTVHDVAYGDAPWQRLDIYVPADAGDRPLDVVVFFYGGRWEQGDKDDYRFAGTALADEHFIVVIPDYSKYPQVNFPVFVQDGAKALAWVSDHIAQYHGDPKRIHVAGHSAGAHIGALLTVDTHYLKAEGKDRSAVIRSFAGLAGPYDFTPDEPDLMDMFGPPQNYPRMQATTYIDGREPPMLLLYGDADKDVNISNLRKVEKRIRQKKGCVKTIIYKDVDHTGLVGALSWYNPHDAAVADDMAAFFREARRGHSPAN